MTILFLKTQRAFSFSPKIKYNISLMLILWCDDLKQKWSRGQVDLTSARIKILDLKLILIYHLLYISDGETWNSFDPVYDFDERDKKVVGVDKGVMNNLLMVPDLLSQGINSSRVLIVNSKSMISNFLEFLHQIFVAPDFTVELFEFPMFFSFLCLQVVNLILQPDLL